MTVIFSTSHCMNTSGSSARIPSISVNSQKEVCLNFYDVKKVKAMDSFPLVLKVTMQMEVENVILIIEEIYNICIRRRLQEEWVYIP